MDKLALAYCAGVIDSDGCITIKKRTNKVRRTNRDSHTSYAPLIQVAQVQPEAVNLLQSIFGGPAVRNVGPSMPGGRPLFRWYITHTGAHAAAKLLLPFLRLKKRQAEIICEFCTTIRQQGFRKPATWYTHTDGEPLLTVGEAAVAKGVSEATVRQAVGNKTVPVVRIPDSTRCTGHKVMIPKRFWDSYTVTNRFRRLPVEYVAWRDQMMAEIKSLNGPSRGVTSAEKLASRN